MTFKIIKPDDIAAFYGFIKQVAQTLKAQIKQGDYSLVALEQSLNRLEFYKKQYTVLAKSSLSMKIAEAKKVVAKADHLAIEQKLANAAITLLQGDIDLLLNDFEKLKKTKVHRKVHLVVTNEQEFLALSYALTNAWKQSLTLEHRPKISHFIADSDFNQVTSEALITQADLVIATIDVKTASLVDIGGMDDLASVKTRSYGSDSEKQLKHSYAQLLKAQLASARENKVSSVLVAKGSPYLLADYTQLADVVLLNFDDRIYNSEHQQHISPGFTAAMAVMFAQQPLTGRLPVSLSVE